MKDPKVTVLMSVYNGEKYLEEAVNSILNQTFEDFEFLIINDGSTDRTLSKLKNYSDSRIKILNNEKNLGLTRSLNIGLKRSKGKYIARMDADDVSMPERLKEEIEFLDSHEDYAAVGTFVYVLDENSEIIRRSKNPIEDAEIRENLVYGNCINHGSVMLRKSCLLDVGYYNETMVRSQDYELWIRLSKKYRLSNLPEYLYKWREHKKNIEAKYIKEQRIFVILAIVKNNVLSAKQATRHFINIFIKKDFMSKWKPLTVVFSLIHILTFKKIKPSTLYSILYRIRFSKKITKILRDVKEERIDFDRAILSLTKIINQRI